MSEYYIAVCRLCSKKMKRYGMMVYPGDPSCCQNCNDEVNREDTKALTPLRSLLPKTLALLFEK